MSWRPTDPSVKVTVEVLPSAQTTPVPSSVSSPVPVSTSSPQWETVYVTALPSIVRVPRSSSEVAR